MLRLISKYFLLLVLFSVVCLSYSCNHSSRMNKDQSTAMLGTKKNTQALLLKQDFTLDLADQNKIVGAYLSEQKLEVPAELGAQNKWLMFEGPVLENELVAYRYYADSRHRFDIYGKIVSDLVMDTVSWDYHDIKDWGSDILKVGNSLGLGSPAIWWKDKLYTLSNCQKKKIEILENGNERSMIRTSFTGLEIDGHNFDLIQDWSIESGKPWSEITLKVSGGSLPSGMKFATGIVKHLPMITQGESANCFYAFNWGKQSFHEENMGMAITADKAFAPSLVNDELSHAFVFDNADSEVTYRFLSAWERDGNKVHNSNEFKTLVEASVVK